MEEMKVIKYGQVDAIWNATKKLMEQDLSVQAQYWLRKNLEKIIEAIKPLDEERIEFIKTEGTKDPSIDAYKISPDNPKIQEMLDREIIVAITPIELKFLADAKLNQRETNLIDFMICEDKMIKIAKGELNS